MTWDYKHDFEFLGNVVKIQHTFYVLVGGTLISEVSVNPFEFVLLLVGFSFKAR